MAAVAGSDGTVGKALEVLDLVASFGRPVRFSEILEQSPYPKATTYRLIQTLTSQRMLAFDTERQTYAPGVRLVRLAHSAWTQSSLAPIARPFIDALSLEVRDTVHLAQLDHAQVLYVDKRNAREPVQMFSQAGKVGPAYCTGVGKAMLAYLPESELAPILSQQSYHRFTPSTLASEEALRAELGNIRARGFAFDREEHEPGIICVALPILTESSRVLGALSVTTTTTRKSLDDLAALAPVIAETARRIAGEASSWRFPDTAAQTTRTGT
ncbi:IclR family transcriptional regulator [Pseudoruegeria sp. SHC-113]|uniref:IclR family transcriptional regulator n=1 Tax=Pseudoruegeria sp. SHC-113 TaxID=2855439 RepID=UPI0021BB02B8|nr:IclR family transcriptional regulator [Pseudoruegeria sp. SHC-113]MCT8158899.1 IclR family transcriptional regulator [Pseudoruegeria sp. SHC-113]